MISPLKSNGAVVAGLIVLAVAVYLLSPLWNVVELNEVSPLTPKQQEALDAIMERTEKIVMEKEEPMPPSATLLAEAAFVARAHDVAGKAQLIQEGDKKIIRFEDFETVNGPNLHIYLAADPAGKDFIDLGEIKATKGSANYDLAATVDTSVYRHVLVWCVPFKVLFSSASL